MNYFINTFLVVAGIITPFLILAVIIAIILSIKDFSDGYKRKQERLLEQEYKNPPYDNITLSQPPNPTMITIRLVKDSKVVWEQSYDKRDFK